MTDFTPIQQPPWGHWHEIDSTMLKIQRTMTFAAFLGRKPLNIQIRIDESTIGQPAPHGVFGAIRLVD
ncbi:MAG: hypothetical protein E6Q97_10010 [Desulfurellales bacterium]|nr:MAG: hypothetical protein E6Q97_10010 [Desulfurellales bacterium]